MGESVRELEDTKVLSVALKRFSVCGSAVAVERIISGPGGSFYGINIRRVEPYMAVLYPVTQYGWELRFNRLFGWWEPYLHMAPAKV